MLSYFIIFYTTIQYKIRLNGNIVYRKVIKMKPLKSKVSITLDEDIIEKIKELAEKDDRSFSQYINMVLKEHLNSKTENKKINNP